MQYDGMTFFNVRELAEHPGLPGLRISRFPADVRGGLEVSGPAAFSRGCEIRLRPEGPILLHLMAVGELAGEVTICWGDYVERSQSLPAGVITAVRLERPPAVERMGILPRERYDSGVCRVVFQNAAVVHYCGREAWSNIAPVRPEDVPERRFVAYGSSISHGALAVSHTNSYLQKTAQLLGMDVHNLALSGGCMCEPVVADLLAAEQWAFLVLELGVNMREHYTPAQFEKRVTYLLDRVTAAHPGAPVFLITIYPNEQKTQTDTLLAERQRAFDEVLRRLGAAYADRSVHLVEGSALLTGFAGLSADILHPSDAGHAQMAHNLAQFVREHISAQSNA